MFISLYTIFGFNVFVKQSEYYLLIMLLNVSVLDKKCFYFSTETDTNITAKYICRAFYLSFFVSDHQPH